MGRTNDGQHVGVRFTPEELAKLDRLRGDAGRSELLRLLVTNADQFNVMREELKHRADYMGTLQRTAQDSSILAYFAVETIASGMAQHDGVDFDVLPQPARQGFIMAASAAIQQRQEILGERQGVAEAVAAAAIGEAKAAT